MNICFYVFLTVHSNIMVAILPTSFTNFYFNSNITLIYYKYITYIYVTICIKIYNLCIKLVKGNQKELYQNNLQNVLIVSRWTFVQEYLAGNCHTILANKIYIDMSGIVNPTHFSLACLLTLAHISLLGSCKVRKLSRTNTHTTNCQIDDSVCIVIF
jgi:hypothetical protein